MYGRKVRSQNIAQMVAESGAGWQAKEIGRDFYRLDSRQRRVLVIGAEASRTVTTVGWLDEWPNLTDFDVVIINLPSLDRATLVRLSRLDKHRLVNMRDELFDLMMSKGEIYCIMAPFMAFGSYLYFGDGSMEPEWSNLKWSPIGFSFTEIRGETVLVEGEVKFEDYLRQVSGWECYLNSTAGLNYIEERLRRDQKLGPEEEVLWQNLPLATNRYGKPLAASLCFGVRHRESGSERMKIRFISDCLHLLPPPTKISLEQGIDLLIEEAKGIPAKTIAPDWSDLYHIPGEEQVEQKIEEMEKRIKSSEREQKRLFQAYRKLQRGKSLLFEHGENLKRVTTEVLQRMGFSVRPYASSPGLLVVQTRYGKILLDTAGRSGPSQPGDLQLLLQHAVFAQEEDGRIWKGILIFNHYRLEDPSQKQSAAFPAEVAVQAREMRLGLVTADGLYAAYCMVLRGSMLREELEERLYREAGIIHLPAIEPNHLPSCPGFMPPRLIME
ncbi:hypothetical protein KAR10_07250 [bacterium]|nr:hypothetical protein [bacterium]